MVVLVLFTSLSLDDFSCVLVFSCFMSLNVLVFLILVSSGPVALVDVE